MGTMPGNARRGGTRVTTTVLEKVQKIAGGFAADRTARQQRRSLDPADFAALRKAGFLLHRRPGGIGRAVHRPCGVDSADL